MSPLLLPFLITGVLIGAGWAFRHEWNRGCASFKASSATGRISIPAKPAKTRGPYRMIGLFAIGLLLLAVSFACSGWQGSVGRALLAVVLSAALLLPIRRGALILRQSALEERKWIIQQRGTVQDQIMRACEREAMERRLRRCQATLMMTRRGGRELGMLFRKLEAQVASRVGEPIEAASLVGAFAAHLRHVFMESDRDDITLGEACEHVARWGAVLRALGCADPVISGAPAPGSALACRRMPAMLMLGATERLGLTMLEHPHAQQQRWTWHANAQTVRLEAEGGGALQLSNEALKDWDAAFLLRHGGIAHAGGSWSFELPLLPP